MCIGSQGFPSPWRKRMCCVHFSFFLEMLQIFLFSRKCTVSRKNTMSVLSFSYRSKSYCCISSISVGSSMLIFWAANTHTEHRVLHWPCRTACILHLCLMFPGKVSDLKISKDKWCGYHKLTLHFSPGHIHIDNKAIEEDWWSLLGFFSVIFTFPTICKSYTLIV